MMGKTSSVLTPAHLVGKPVSDQGRRKRAGNNLAASNSDCKFGNFLVF